MLITEITNVQLNERFPMSYDMFGWIKPGGQIILATPKQAASSKAYYHRQVIQELGYSEYSDAFRAGYVRWLLQSNILVMETDRPVTDSLIQTVYKGTKNIEKLTQDPKKFHHFAGVMSKQAEPLHVIDYSLEARGFWKSTPSLSALINIMKKEMEQ